MPYVVLVVGFVVALWLVLIFSQRLAQRRFERMIAQVKEGDEVVTLGGVYGVVRVIEGEKARLEIAPGVEVRLARRAIARIVSSAGSEDDGEAQGVTDGQSEPGPPS